MNKSPFHTPSKRLDRICAIVFLAVMVVACLFRALPYKSAQNTWQSDVFVKLQNTDDDKRVRFLSEPFFLKKGIYTLQYDSNIAQETEVVLGDFNRLQTEVDADIEDHIQFLPFRVTGQAHREIRILAEEDIAEAALLVREFYEGNGTMHADVQASLVYRPALSMSCYALDTILCFAVLAVLLHCIFHGCKNPKNPESWIPLFLFALTILISLPLFRNYVTYGHDTEFHVERIANLAEELFAGRIPPRLAQTWKNGHGFPVSIFYGDIFMIPAAVLFRLGIPLFRSYQLYLLMLNTATVLISYHCFQKLSGNALAACLGSAAYAGSARYAANLYLRSAIGEDSAMAVMPLVVLGFAYLFGESDITLVEHEVEMQIQEETRRHKAMICLVTGFTALIQVHTLSTVQVTVLASIFCILNIRTLFRNKRLQTIVISAGLTALINTWFIVPFVDYYARHNLYVKIPESVSDSAVKLSSLLLPEKAYKTLGIGTLLLLVFCFCAFRDGLVRKNRGIVTCFALAVFSVLLGTELFPWTWIEKNMTLLYDILGGKIQFVWRYFSMATLLVCVSAECIIRVTKKQEKEDGRIEKGMLVFLGALALLSLFESIQIGLEKDDDAEDHAVLRAADVWNGEGGDALYMFDDLVWYEVPPDTVTAGEGVTFTNATHEGTAWQADVENTAEEESYIEFPVWNYYGYRAKLEKEAGPSTGSGTRSETGSGSDPSTSSGIVVDGEQHRVRVLVPAGFSGHVSMRFQEPWYWRVAEAVSALTAMWLVFRALRRRRAYDRMDKKAEEGRVMNMTENANLIQFLQSIGWNDAQITNLILCVEGRVSIDEASEKHKEKQ